MKRIGYLAFCMIGTVLCVALLLIFSPPDVLAEDIGFWLIVVVWPICFVLLIGIIVWQVRILGRMRARLVERSRKSGPED